MIYNLLGLVYDLAGFIISIPIEALILMGLAKILGVGGSFKTALKIALIMSLPFLVSMVIQNANLSGLIIVLVGISILVLSFVMSFFLIKFFYKLDLKKAFLLWIIFAVVDFTFLLVFEFVMEFVLRALGFNMDFT